MFIPMWLIWSLGIVATISIIVGIVTVRYLSKALADIVMGFFWR